MNKPEEKKKKPLLTIIEIIIILVALGSITFVGGIIYFLYEVLQMIQRIGG